MSIKNYKLNQIDKTQARKKIGEILRLSKEGPIFSKHALSELANDGLTTTDAVNVLKSCNARILRDGEFENGSFRYRLETAYILLVISFNQAGTKIIVITAWDKRTRG
ncbi:MAG: DUF4258 domain-containing protein [Bacteriovorax sp.]|nr:DUF4258 domain-containing protein [Bacteriovorax sp.]